MTAAAHSATPAPSAAGSAPPLHEKALLSMLSNMEALTALYHVELDAIELRDMKRFSDIQSEKNRLVQDCEVRMKDITLNHAFLKTINPALKERIVTTETELRDLASKSQRLCQIREESVRRVQKRLLDAARHLLEKEETPLYNNRGTTGLARNKPVATAINEAI